MQNLYNSMPAEHQLGNDGLMMHLSIFINIIPYFQKQRCKRLYRCNLSKTVSLNYSSCLSELVLKFYFRYQNKQFNSVILIKLVAVSLQDQSCLKAATADQATAFNSIPVTKPIQIFKARSKVQVLKSTWLQLMLFAIAINIARQTIYSSDEKRLGSNNQIIQVLFEEQLSNSGSPILTLLQTMPYVQSIQLSITNYYSSSFEVFFRANSALSGYVFSSVRVGYLVFGYHFNYAQAYLITSTSQQQINHQPFIGSNNCKVQAFIIGFDIVVNSLQNQNVDLHSSAVCSSSSISLTIYFSNVVYQDVTFSVLRLDDNYIDSATHVQLNYANQYQQHFGGTPFTVSNLPDFYSEYAGYFKGITGITKFKLNSKFFYFKTLSLEGNMYQIEQIGEAQELRLQQTFVMNYPQYLSKAKLNPEPASNSVYFNPTQKSYVNIGPNCYFCLQINVHCQSLQLHYYYNINSQTCQSCPARCIFCSNSINCVICTPFAVLNIYTGVCSCRVGSYQSVQSVTVCRKCQSHCTDCTSNVMCLSCQNMFNLVSGICQPTVVCQIGEFLNSQQTSCLPCHFSCYSCTAYTNCFCFKMRHTLQNSGQVCRPCQAGCQRCSSASVCQTCILQAYLQNGECVCLNRQKVIAQYECVPCNKLCLTCLPNNQCSCFKMGQTLGKDGSCIACPHQCIYCLIPEECLECNQANTLANGMCLKHCPANSTMNTLSLFCECDFPFYSKTIQSKVSCYLDEQLSKWNKQNLQFLIVIRKQVKNVSRQLGNVITIMLLVGLSSLIGETIESFTILKLHLFYLLPIHPFLQILLGVFQNLLNFQVVNDILAKLQGPLTSNSTFISNSKLVNYTNQKKLFVVNSIVLFLQFVFMCLRHLIITLVSYFVKPNGKGLGQTLIQTKSLLKAQGVKLLRCSKIDLLIYSFIQLLSFGITSAYIVNVFICTTVFSIINLNQYYCLSTKVRFSVYLFRLTSRIRTSFLVCFIAFRNVLAQSILPILFNLPILIYMLAIRSFISRKQFLSHLIQTGVILILQVYLFLGMYFSNTSVYSLCVYVVVGCCLLHIFFSTYKMMKKTAFSIIKRLKNISPPKCRVLKRSKSMIKKTRKTNLMPDRRIPSFFSQRNIQP